jgi:hypothetical protein
VSGLDPTPGSRQPVRVSRGRTRMLGPEWVAGALVVVVVVLASAVTRGLGSGAAEPSPSPSPSGSAVAPQPSRLVDRAIADLLVTVNQQLIEAGDQAAEEVARDTGRTTEIATLVREINATARYGADRLPALGSTPEALDLIERLAPVYDEIRTIADETLRASINNAAAYEQGATRLIEVIAGLPPFQLELQALRDQVVVASVPPASAPPSGVPSDAPPSDAPPTDAPSAAPTEPSPSGSPGPSTGPSQVVNGGFETGVGTAWRLVVADGVIATVRDDRTDPASGEISARVDLGTVSAAYAGVSLQQAGMRLEAGASYTISVALRSEAVRDVRVRVASSDGSAYLTRIALAGPTWIVSSFTFLAPARDDQAVIQIDLGRSDATTWIDDVVLGPSIEP